MDSAPPAPKGLARNTANYGDRDFALYLRRFFAKSMGYSRAMLVKTVCLPDANSSPRSSGVI